MHAASSAQAADERAWAAGASPAWLRPVAVSTIALLLAAVAVTVVVSGDVLLRPGWFALFSAYNVLAFALAGTLWLARRERSRIGLLLLGLMVLVAWQSLQGSSSSLAFSIGVLADPVAALLAWYLFLSFPSVRLTRPAAAIWGVGVAAVVIGFAPWFFLSEHVAGATPLARCTPACPTNALLIANRPDVAGHFGTIEEVLAVAFSVGVVALLLSRFAVASPPRRRALAPVTAVGIWWLAAFGAYYVAKYIVVTDEGFWQAIGWVLTGARVALPLAFLLSLALAQMYAGRALERMILRLRLRPRQTELERVAAEALGDPVLQLAVWSRTAEEWIPADESEALPPVPQSGRARRELWSDGARVAEIDYDDALDDDPELLDAAAAAIVLSLDTARLDAERRAVSSQLREARQLAAAAGLSERRRLERDLHDGAQQQLIAMRIRLNLMSEQADGSEMSAELAELTRELDDALDEIRAIAHSSHPAFQGDGGLLAALAHSVASDPRAQLDGGELRAHSQAVEVAVYFSTLEALQNASKHCALDSEIAVRVWDDRQALHFEVADDGPGFEPSSVTQGRGLAGITDRMAEVGGTLTIDSAPGRGTRITGSVYSPLR